MKNKLFRYGHLRFNAYLKAAGNGFEIGLIDVTHGAQSRKPVFVGNFIHREEAAKYWATMNTEMNRFLKRFWVAEGVSVSWYRHFFANTLYRSYYTFVDRWIERHTRSTRKALVSDLRKYSRLKRDWKRRELSPLKKAA